MKKRNTFSFIALFIGLTLVILNSCDLGSPDAGDLDNPWDPNNPNRPRAPEGLVAEALSATDVLLTWRDLSGNEDGFDVYEKTLTDTVFYLIKSTEPDVDSLILSDHQPNTEYEYWIFAFNDYGNSDSSNYAHVLMPGIPPIAPTSLTARVIPETDIQFSWRDMSEDETTFNIFESAGDTTDFIEVLSIQPDDTSAIIFDRIPLVKYYYRINARNEFGESEISSTINITPAALPPFAPSNLVVTDVTWNEITLNWQDNSSIEEGVEIFESINDDQHFRLVKTTTKNQSSGILINRLVKTTYFYKIRAVNQWGQSEFSNNVSATTEEFPEALAPPSDLSAESISTSEIVLSWTDNNEHQGEIEIFESIGDSLNFSSIRIIIASDTVDTLTGLFDNTTYFYRIRAMVETNLSDFSNIANALTDQVLIPDAPTNLIAWLDDGTNISLIWEDNSYNEPVVPTGFDLAGAYPNPFNSTTKVCFDLPHSEHIQITVFDITGKAITELVNERSEAGTFSVSWDAMNFSTGIYFCQMKAGSYTKTVKLALMK